jgi:hypothetical protein
MNMSKYEVTMRIEADGPSEDDPDITKLVEAKDEHEALDKARLRVQEENPEQNHRKIWFWAIRHIYS